MSRESRAAADAAFVEFMTTAQPSLLRLAYFLTGSQDQARELTQEALVRAYVRWPKIREGEALAYTRKILSNLRIDRGRLSSREVAAPTLLDQHLQNVPAESGAELEEREQVVAMLRGLPERQRKVVVLRYCCDLSERECSTLLGISVGAVKSQASRGLAALRDRSTVAEGGRS